MGETSPEKKSGCGLLTAVFGARGLWPRKPDISPRNPTPSTHKTQRVASDHGFSVPSNVDNHQKHGDRIIARPGSINSKSPPVYKPHHHHDPHPYHQAKPKIDMGPPGFVQARKLPQAALGLSGELDTMIADHQKSKGPGNLVRASSSNVMLFGNLGNLRGPVISDGNGRSATTVNHLPRPAKEGDLPPNKPVSLCRAVSTRMDPEQLKILGNEDYKNGRFAEAVALYEAAISIDPNKASYRSNKSAALTALGRLLEAAFECREAIRIDPFYQRAHNRLATLYVRLGEPEKAVYHFKQAGSDADPDAMNKAKKVQFHLQKCTEAKSHCDWNKLLKETDFSIASGADSAPLILALKAEALVKLHRHQDAIDTIVKGPNFEIEECMKFFGPIGSATLLVIHAQVYMIEGRFDDAVAAAQRASRLDPNNRDANAVLSKTKGIAAARANGNNLFKASRFQDACNTYSEGLNHDPHNAVLLCNRAACCSKLGQFEKAIKDCTAALNVRPSYAKARLRRADCNAKMENWRACLQDCEVLMRENPDDEEVIRMLKDAKQQLQQRL